MKVDINTQKVPQFITWPLVIGFAVPIVATLYKAFEVWFY